MTEPAPEPTPTPVPEPDDDLSKAKGETKKWRGRAESNYEILRKLGITKPEEADDVVARLQRQQALEDDAASEKDKAVKDARNTTGAEKDAHYQPLLAKTAFQVAIGDRKSAEEVEEFLGDLNLSRFLTEKGDVDVAKVLARVEQFAPVVTTPAPPAPRGPQMPGTPTPGAPPRPGNGADAKNYIEQRFGKQAAAQ